MKMEMESRMSLQSLNDSEVFSPCSIEHQDVFMYEDDKRVIHCNRSDTDSPTYLDISASKSSSFPVKQEPDPDTLMSWTQKHPEHWSQNEILDWIYFVASTIDVDPTTIRGEGFQNITGPELCRMSLEDFQKRDPVNGRCFYDMFRSLHKDAFFIEPQGCDFNSQDQYWDTCREVKSEQFDSRDCEQADNMSKLLDCRLSEKDMQVLVGNDWYSIDFTSLKDFDEALHEVAMSHPWPKDCGYSGSDSESISDASEMETSTSSFPRGSYRDTIPSTGSDVLSDEEYLPSVPTTVEKETKTRKSTTPRKKPTVSKGNHLWEFIRDLLKDPKCNPLYLRWEEKETGVFRFVQSEAVAQMWGRKKNNAGMTYEKLSRAMRFCRTAGYFAEVPKTGKFPKKLCFRFGAKAYGWED